MKVRRPCQAGAFYAGTSNALRKQIEGCFLHDLGPGEVPKVLERIPRRIVALVCPHAGYMYSGPIAAHSYHSLATDGRPDTLIILGPNHVGYGSAVSMMAEGVWQTPLGNIEIDSELAKRIQSLSKYVDIEDSAHRFEHSIEVQLPFIQYLYGASLKFIPICFLLQDLVTSRDVGEAIAKASVGKNVVTIASTDLTHYESQKRADEKDHMVIEAILKLDEERLESIVETYNVTMCGYGPVMTAIVAAKNLQAKKAELLCYKTSGDITGDYRSVVGYASIAITK